MVLSKEVLHVLGKFEVAFVTLFAGLLISKIVGKLARHLFREAELNRILESAGFKPMSDTFGNIIEYALYFFTLIAVLQQFGLTGLVFKVLGVILLFVLIGSTILAVRDFFPNFFTGLYLRSTLKSLIGKRVKIGIVQGTLTKVGLLSSTIKAQDEEYIPHLYSFRERIKRIQAS